VEGPRLKRGRARSVFVERDRGEDRVVKRFAGPTAIRRFGDRARALREFEILRTLTDRGVRVPHPVATRSRAGGHEVVMASVPGAIELERALDGSAPMPVARERLARSLGRLLAELHAAGLDHPDLHAGNALLDADGEPWAIDFHSARLRRALGPELLRRDLARACAAVRERTTERFRARGFLAWWNELDPRLRTRLGSRAALASDVEERARSLRREVVAKRSVRWLRESKSVRVVRSARGRRFERADVAPQRIEALLTALSDAAANAQRVADGIAVVSGLPRAQTRAAWRAAARLFEHGIRAARPLVLIDAPRPLAVFELAPNSTPYADAPRDRAIRALGAWFAALHDRGLRLEPTALESFWIDPLGRACLAPPFALADLEQTERARSLDEWRRRLEELGHA
jgi:RIO-like serine/threonine protein kinase